MTDEARENLRHYLRQIHEALYHGESCICVPCVIIKPEKQYYTDEGGECG